MKLLIVLIVFTALQSCSFDNKTGIWKNANISNDNLKKQETLFKDFKKLELNNSNFFNKTVVLNEEFRFLKSPIVDNSEWNDVFYSESNLHDNFLYSDRNEIILRSKKFSRNKLSRNILYYNDTIISSDKKGNLIFYSINKKKIIQKYNFYKKKFKSIEKNLNFILDNNKLIISDNIGYLYAYDLVENRVIWAKNFKIPFRSNLKIYKNNILAANQNNILYVINKINGNLTLQIPTEEVLIKNNFKNNLSIDGSNLFYLNTFGSLYSFNLNNFKMNWFQNINSSLDLGFNNLFNSKIIKVKNNKIIISTNTNLIILDALTGLQISKIPLISKTEPMIYGNYIFLINNNNLLVSISLTTGKIIYSHSIEEKIANFLNSKKKKILIKSMKIVNNQLYVYLRNAYIVKLELNGQIKDIQKLKKNVYSNIIFANKSFIYFDDKNRLIIVN
jgi:outer membrane protein assembly factor BamB